MTPKRIQRKRTRGWKAPEGAVYVGRPSRWGNPWVVGLRSCGCRSIGECTHNLFRCETPKDAMDAYRNWVVSTIGINPRFAASLTELRGKDLMCWCPLDQPCHADVLLELANATQEAQRG